MAEKKVRKTAAKTTATKTVKKATEKKAELVLDAENAGFKAGDVYQTLAAAGSALSLAEVAKDAKISADEALLGIGWLFKEGKIKNEDGKIALA